MRARALLFSRFPSAWKKANERLADAARSPPATQSWRTNRRLRRSVEAARGVDLEALLRRRPTLAMEGRWSWMAQ